MSTSLNLLFYGQSGAGKSHLINKLLTAVVGVALLPNHRAMYFTTTIINFGGPASEFRGVIDIVRGWRKDELGIWSRCTLPRRDRVRELSAITDVAAGIEKALAQFADDESPITVDVTVQSAVR